MRVKWDDTASPAPAKWEDVSAPTTSLLTLDPILFTDGDAGSNRTNRTFVSVGYDPDMRVRYVTALARAGGPRIRFDEVADVKNAERVQNQGNYRLTWQVSAGTGHSAYFLIAHGHDGQYLDSYSLKKVEQKEID